MAETETKPDDAPKPRTRHKDSAARFHTYIQWLVLAWIIGKCPELAGSICGVVPVPFVCAAAAATAPHVPMSAPTPNAIGSPHG